jgi:hypothetical protein
MLVDAHKLKGLQLLAEMCDKICNSRGLFILSFMIALILAPISAEIKTDHPLKRLRTGKDIRWTFQFSGLPNDPQSVMIDRVENVSEDDTLNEDSNNMIDDLVQPSRDDDMSMIVHSRTPTTVGNVSFEPSTISSFPMSPSTSKFPSTDTPTAVNQPTISPISLVPVTMPIATPIIEPVATPTFLSPVANFPVIVPTGPPLGSSVPSNLPTNINGIPSFSPTLICGKTAEQRRVEIVSQVTEALDANVFVLLNATSPQSRALNWLLNERNETTCPGIKLLQRWVLATIYFSTGGDEWFKCSNRMGANDNCGSEAPFVDKKRFLSEDNECLWAGITCDMDKCVTAIEFGTCNLS